MHMIAAKAVALGEALKPDFRAYQERILANARTLSSSLQELGLRLVSGGTDNHLMLVDMTALNVTGRVAELALDHAGIACNKNMIPFDPLPPLVTSGIRLGTPAATTRGFGEAEMRQVAEWIVYVLKHNEDTQAIAEVRAQTRALCQRFPLPY